MHKFHFTVGWHESLHAEPSINFQMNRWIAYLGESALEDMRSIAPRLADFPAWSAAFLSLADRALAEGRRLHAAYYYRSAEFFMPDDDSARIPARNKFLSLIREEYLGAGVERYSIPYADGGVKGFLSAYRFRCPNAKDTLVIHGGFDSCIEEFFPLIQYIHDEGYDLVCFDGPGQGTALMESRLLLTHEWHKPVGAILDYFGLSDVTLLGISMGGCLALRAAAFEPRVRRVVAYDVFFDWMDTSLEKLKPLRPLLRLLIKLGASRLFNVSMAGIMKKSPLFGWAMRQAKAVLGASTAFEVFRKSRSFTTRDISPRVTQDVLLLAGSADHVIPLRHLYLQLDSLKNAKSLTARVFSRAECAHSHCQVGNLRLAVDCILRWVESSKPA